MKYRKKPVVVEAVQLRWDTWSEMCEFAGVGKVSEGHPEGTMHDQNGYPVADGEIAMFVPTLNGVTLARQGDWIIKGPRGDVWPCKPVDFAETYEAVEPCFRVGRETRE